MASSSSAVSGRGSAPQCFVTVGATAGFRTLLAEVASPAFFSTIAGLGFGRLAVQCGPDLAWFKEKVAGHGTGTCGIEVEAFDLTNDMQAYMLACRSERGNRRPGCIISHAGKPIAVAWLECPTLIICRRNRNRPGGNAVLGTAGGGPQPHPHEQPPGRTG
jgi:UDP-N-acetylglucosamine transferase subunit ALG13